MPQLCTYKYEKTGIHTLTLLKSSEAAVDQFLIYLDRICTTEEQANILIDFSQTELPPVNYFVTHIKDWQAARPCITIGCKAVVYRGTGMTRSLLENIAGLVDFFNLDTTQLYQMKHRQAAIDWLQDKTAPVRSA